MGSGPLVRQGNCRKSRNGGPGLPEVEYQQSYVIGLPETRRKPRFPSVARVLLIQGRAENGPSSLHPMRPVPFGGARRPSRPDKASVSARRVYRLRIGESVKVLNAAEGEACSPAESSAGEWYFVQATDGTRGYVFRNDGPL